MFSKQKAKIIISHFFPNYDDYLKRMANLIYLFLLALILLAIYYIFFILSDKAPDNLDSRQAYLPVTFRRVEAPTINNEYLCDLDNLKICDINNKVSCFGCKNFTTVCQHFDKDITTMINGTKSILPKNKTKTEGYCLPIERFTSRCNPYHGDLVLGGVNGQYGLFCLCKNNGLLTNTTINGNCETPSNQITYPLENINVPADKLKCICPAGLYSSILNGIPTCVQDTITSVGKFQLKNQEENGNYNQHLSTAANVILTYNPCNYCFLTGQRVYGTKLGYVGDTAICFGSADGLPIRRDENARLLKGDFGPDAVIKMPAKYYLIQIYTTKYNVRKYCKFVIATEEMPKYWSIYYVGKNDKFNFFFFSEKHQIHLPGSFNVIFSQHEHVHTFEYFRYPLGFKVFTKKEIKHCSCEMQRKRKRFINSEFQYAENVVSEHSISDGGFFDIFASAWEVPVDPLAKEFLKLIQATESVLKNKNRLWTIENRSNQDFANAEKTNDYSTVLMLPDFADSIFSPGIWVRKDNLNFRSLLVLGNKIMNDHIDFSYLKDLPDF